MDDYLWHSNERDKVYKPRMPDPRCNGRPRQWNMDIQNDEAAPQDTFNNNNRKKLWNPAQSGAVIDLNVVLQWLQVRGVMEHLGPAVYQHGGWWRMALNPDTLDHVCPNEVLSDSKYVRGWHGLKLYALPNAIRYGVACSFSKEHGHRFFHGLPGTYCFIGDDATKAGGYCVGLDIDES